MRPRTEGARAQDRQAVPKRRAAAKRRRAGPLLRAACLASTLALASCGHSPPTHYFSLDAVPPSVPLTTAAAAMTPVQLGAVRVPAALDRPEVVAQHGAHRLAVRENDRWGAPLGQMMRSALAQDLLARLPAGKFVLPEAPAPEGTRGIVVTVLDLRASTSADTTANARLTLEGSWTLTAGQPAQAVATQAVSLSEPMSSGDSTAIADALSRVLARLADRIAASLAARP